MIPSGVRVFLASQPVDFRKGPDGLLSLVRDAGSDPFNGALYVFRAKRADRVQLNHAQLMALLDGLDWKKIRHVAVKAPVFAG